MDYTITNDDMKVILKQHIAKTSSSPLVSNENNFVCSRNTDFIANVIANKLNVNKANTLAISKTLTNTKRVLYIDRQDITNISVCCNDVRLFKPIARMYNSIGISVTFDGGDIIVPNSKLYLKLVIPFLHNRMNLIIQKTLELADIFYHISVKDIGSKKDKCTYDNCEYNNTHVFTYPELCFNHLCRVSLQSLDDLVSKKNVAIANVINRYNNIYDIETILFGHRKFKPNITGSKICKKCGNTIIMNIDFITDMFCKRCFEKINWKRFELDYKNGIIEWEDLLSKFNEYRQ